jgi:arylformamidase
MMEISRPYEIVDVSMPLPDEGLSFPGDRPVRVDGPFSHVMGHVREFCYTIAMSTQAGTHVQGGHYFRESGRRIDAYALHAFEGPAIFVDCSRRVIERSDLVPSLGDTDLGTAKLVLRTGYSRILVEEWRRTGSIPDELLLNKPGLTVDAARWLLDRGASFLGIDAPGFELYPTEDHRVNQLLCEREALLLENLTNLDRLPRSGCWIEFFPLPVVGVEGTPCRAIVKVPGAASAGT